MNGFIFWNAAGNEHKNRFEKPLPVISGTKTTCEVFAKGEALLFWGGKSGDIHYSRNGDETFTVVSGYISEIEGSPQLDQEQTAAFLCEWIEADASTLALRTLLKRLHGSFSIFHQNLRHKFCVCLTDRLASRPLWTYRTNETWIVSSNPAAIATAVAQKPKIDLGSLGAFLLYGGPVQPRKSLFEGVESLHPGTILRIDHINSQRETKWYTYAHRPESDHSISSCLNLAHERLVRSAARIAKRHPRPVVFFSGGLDSRLTAAALKAAGADPLLVTLGDTRNLEVTIAAAAAAAMGLRHKVILRDKHWYLTSLQNTVFETGGNFLWTHGHFSRAVRTLQAEVDTQVYLLGDLCEAFSKLFCSVKATQSRLWSPEEFVRNFDDLRLPLYRPQNRARTLSLLNPAIRADVNATLLRDISQRYQFVSGLSQDPLIVADLFFRWESMATLPTFSMFLDLRSAGAERNIMLDNEVLDFLEIAPGSLRNGANLGANLLKRLNAPASRIPNSNSLLPVCWPPPLHKLSKACKPTMGKLRRLLMGNSHFTTGAWPKKSALYATDLHWRDYFAGLFSNRELFPADLFDLDAVHNCWLTFLHGDVSRANDVEKLIQFAILNEQTQPVLSLTMNEAGF